MNTYRALLVAFGVLFIGCDQVPSPEVVTHRDSAGVVITESAAPAWEGASPWHLDSVPLLDLSAREGSSPVEFHRVEDMLRLPDGRIAVANSGNSEVLLFSSDGRWLGSFGANGDGPGDFRNLRSLHWSDPDTLIAFDFNVGRLTLMNGDLELERVVSLPDPTLIREVFVFADGTFALLQIYPTLLHHRDVENEIVRGRVPLVRVSSTGDVLDTLAVIPGLEEFVFTNDIMGSGAGPALFARDGLVAAGRDRLIVGEADDLAYSVLGTDGQLLERVRVPSYDLSISPTEVTDEISAFTGPDPTTRRAQMWTEYFSHYPKPTSRAAYDKLIVDETDHVWARRYRGLSGEDAPRQWEIFDSHGQWLGAFSTPAEFRIMEIGEDEVLGVHTDTLDVQHPQILRLIRGS